MAIQITAREFREKQASIFDLADQGEQIIIRRGKKQSYTLVPINEDDLYFTSEMLAKIDQVVQEVKEEKTIAMTEKTDQK